MHGSNGKECLLQSIEATLEQHCIYDILHSLVHHCQTEAKNLKVQVMNIDVRKDTEKLRLISCGVQCFFWLPLLSSMEQCSKKHCEQSNTQHCEQCNTAL